MSAVIVPRPIVEEAVKTAFGPRTKVIGHTTKTLTAPGDNFATTVVCLQVELETSPDTSETTSGVHTISEIGVIKDIRGDCKVLLDVNSTSCKNEDPGPIDSASAKDQINYLGNKDFIAKSDNGTNSTDQRLTDNSRSTTTWTCIAKTNSKNESVFFKIFSKFAFDNEISFYKTLLPALNEELSKSKAAHLKASDYYFSHKEVNNELIIMEDLRRSGFTMGDKSRGLDSRRCTEVVKELARMHSASILVRRNHVKTTGKTPPDVAQADKSASDADKPNGIGCRNVSVNQHESETRFDAMDLMSRESYLAKDGQIMNIFVGLIHTRITSALDLLSKKQNTDKEVAWLKSIEADIPVFLRRMLVECKPEFLVLCHGDTWINNFLFSPNLDAVSMVDFQFIRPASLATDLNYLFYTSHLGYFNITNIDKILDAYYVEFTTILGAQGYHMPFTRKALSAEVEAKKQWGVIGGILTLPMIFPQQLQDEDGGKSSINELDKKASKIETDTIKHYVEKKDKEAMADMATKSNIKGTKVDHHSDPKAKHETSPAADLKGHSVGGYSEVPCSSTFEEKFVKLLKNITQ